LEGYGPHPCDKLGPVSRPPPTSCSPPRPRRRRENSVSISNGKPRLCSFTGFLPLDLRAQSEPNFSTLTSDARFPQSWACIGEAKGDTRRLFGARIAGRLSPSS